MPPAGCECRVEWLPSRDDLRAHPEIPAAAVVRGRLIVAHVVGQDGKRFKLYQFTSGEEPREMWVELYRRRWDIELDIRSLKQTLRMHSANSASLAGVRSMALAPFASKITVSFVEHSPSTEIALKLVSTAGRRNSIASPASSG